MHGLGFRGMHEDTCITHHKSICHTRHTMAASTGPVGRCWHSLHCDAGARCTLDLFSPLMSPPTNLTTLH